MVDGRVKILLSKLGKLVTVRVEIPAGGKAEGADTVYSLNYGHVGSTDRTSRFGAYVYGVQSPMSSFTGKVIAAVRRFDTEEDALIVAPVGREAYEPWIREAIRPMEGERKFRLFCLYEKSCGVIPYRVRDGRREYLALFQPGSSTWSFPKGHMEYGEDETATARREVMEEIGANLDIDTSFRCEIHYAVHNRRCKKTVVLFAVPFDGEIFLREGEIGDAKWLPRDDIQKLFGHRELRTIFNRLERQPI